MGDKIRLADTELFIEIEKDFQTYGEENKFGGGKTIRDGMGQSSTVTDKDCLDMCILGAVIIDHWGIVKADIGIKDGKIVGVGKAGNPDTQDGVSPNMIIGPATEVHGGWGYIVTAGGIDTHIHYICPEIADTALYSGVTTLIGEVQDLTMVPMQLQLQEVNILLRECCSLQKGYLLILAFLVRGM